MGLPRARPMAHEGGADSLAGSCLRPRPAAPTSVICPGFVETKINSGERHEMPGLISAEGRHEILAGLKTDQFMIHFPKHFTRKMGMPDGCPTTPFQTCRRPCRVSSEVTMADSDITSAMRPPSPADARDDGRSHRNPVTAGRFRIRSTRWSDMTPSGRSSPTCSKPARPALASRISRDQTRKRGPAPSRWRMSGGSADGRNTLILRG